MVLLFSFSNTSTCISCQSIERISLLVNYRRHLRCVSGYLITYRFQSDIKMQIISTLWVSIWWHPYNQDLRTNLALFSRKPCFNWLYTTLYMHARHKQRKFVSILDEWCFNCKPLVPPMRHYFCRKIGLSQMTLIEPIKWECLWNSK